MSVAIQVGKIHNLLSEQEMREVRAVQNYPKRKLTDLEQAIKDLGLALAGDLLVEHDVLMAGNEMRSMNPGDIVDRICKATSMFTVRELARKAPNEISSMMKLIQMYPYVEFNNVINGNGLNVFQSMHLRGVSLTRIQEAALWLYNFGNCVLEIPEVGNKHWFIGTPGTRYHYMRNAISTHPEASGLALNELLQSKFNAMLRDTGKHNHPLQLIQEYNLHKVPNFLARFGLLRPAHRDAVLKKVVPVVLHIEDNFRIGNFTESVLTATLTEYPIMGVESIAAYRFVL